MKAMVYRRYGSPDVLRLEEVNQPEPGDQEVLVKVHAASVNSWDWDLLTGTPIVFRFWGLFRPKHIVLGADIAGRVAAVGRKVTRFRPGDAVFGDLSACGWGGFAEYVCAKQDALSLKPASMSFQEAAAMPQAAGMALQALRDVGQIQPKQKLLMNGAGGGVGTFVVQLAKSLGAEVTGVDARAKLPLLRTLGADQVVDYAQEDFTKSGPRYHLIIDVAAHRSMFDYERALLPGGTYVLVGGSPARMLQLLLLAPWISLRRGTKLRILAARPNQHLEALKDLYQAGSFKPILDRCYSFREAPEALRQLGEGHVQGKVVINIASE
jgi:NADPH:quinone reductase-like Zn-dependent oxidoreductase